MSASNWVHIDGKIEAETDKAFLIDFGDQGKHWIPITQIADANDYKVGDAGTISISEWIADQKELEGDE